MIDIFSHDILIFIDVLKTKIYLQFLEIFISKIYLQFY